MKNLGIAVTHATGRGRYRRIRSRLWAEPAFAQLTDMEKLTALYLLSGPQTTATGLMRFSIASAAEDLRCSGRQFQKRLDVVLRAFGWRYDPAARVLWIREWISENPPQNPNVVQSWRKAFNEIPNCPLKTEAWNVVREFVSQRGESFTKPLDEPFGESLAEPTANDPSNTPVPVPDPDSDSEGATVGSSRLARQVANAIETDRIVAKLISRRAARRVRPEGTPLRH